MMAMEELTLQQLVDFLTGADAIDLKKIRPLALARTWAVSANAVIELCVAAQRSGAGTDQREKDG